MIPFDEEKEQKQLEDFKKREEEELVATLAQVKYGVPYADLSTVIVENEALRVVPEELAKKIGVAPFKILGKKIHIAVRAPEQPEVLALKNELTEKGYTPILFMASNASLAKVWERYKELSQAEQSRVGGLDVSGDTLLSLGEQIKTFQDVEKVIEAAAQDKKVHKISRMLEIILAGAIALNASDVHIEPEEKDVRLRFRLDGYLQDVMHFGHDVFHLLDSRIKLLSGMKITTDKNAQDGRFSIFIKEDEISMRTSLIPGAYGESIVMRILNPKAIKVKLEELGIEPKLFEVIQREIKKPNGMILVTGPTGSGKTTTLYAFLRRIYSPEIKIITIEDPIEYHLAGITQTQVEETKGYTFLDGLRSVLRQDPDVIMVGEIRDDETAKIAVESALTGHLFFSTLHTNNAAGVIPRLIELKINPKILVSALSLSMAQRLVRKLCVNCKQKKVPTDEERARMKKVLDDAAADGKDLSFYGVNKDQEIEMWGPVGCEKCNNLGYKGQIGVFEAIYTDENIEKIIPENPSEREIKRVARKQGILDMKEDGVIKVMKGVTSLEELEGVVVLTEE